MAPGGATRDVRGVVLLEVLVALAILILGMAAVGMQVNVGLRVANNSEVATRAVMLAQSKMAELDAGIVQVVPNQEMEGDFGLQYPGWAWRMYVDQTDTPDLNMVTLQLLYKPGVAFREEITDYNLMTVVHTSYTLRATPANMDLRRDFGFTEDQLQEASDNIPIPGFDPTNIDPGMIAQLDPEMLAEILPKLMELLGSNAALLNTLPQAARDQIKQAMEQAAKEGQSGDEGEGRGQNRTNTGGDGGMLPDGLDRPTGGRNRSDRLGGNAQGFDSPARQRDGGRGGNRDNDGGGPNLPDFGGPRNAGRTGGGDGGPTGGNSRTGRSGNRNNDGGGPNPPALGGPRDTGRSGGGDGGPTGGNSRTGRGGNRNNDGGATNAPDFSGPRDTGRPGRSDRGPTGSNSRTGRGGRGSAGGTGGPGSDSLPPPGFGQGADGGGSGNRSPGFNRNPGGGPQFGEQGNTNRFGNSGGRTGSGFTGSRSNSRGGSNSGSSATGGFGAQGGNSRGGTRSPGSRLQQPPGFGGQYQVPSEQDLYRRPGR